MKKKNKFRLEILITALIIIIPLFGGIFVAFIQDKQEFKIIKEECWKEIGEYGGYNCSDGYITIPSYFEEMGVESYTLKDGKFCQKIHKNFTKETCKQIEVNEIETFYGKISPKYTLNFKEWLQENCEWYNGEPCEDLECSNRKWEEYKCGEYFVKVENE